jgi:hypothetical protein
MASSSRSSVSSVRGCSKPPGSGWRSPASCWLPPATTPIGSPASRASPCCAAPPRCRRPRARPSGIASTVVVPGGQQRPPHGGHQPHAHGPHHQGLRRPTHRRLCEAGLVASMGTVGDALDNAVAESFFVTLECELLDRHPGPPTPGGGPPCSTSSRSFTTAGDCTPPTTQWEQQHATDPVTSSLAASAPCPARWGSPGRPGQTQSRLARSCVRFQPTQPEARRHVAPAASTGLAGRDRPARR